MVEFTQNSSLEFETHAFQVMRVETPFSYFLIFCEMGKIPRPLSTDLLITNNVFLGTELQQLKEWAIVPKK